MLRATIYRVLYSGILFIINIVIANLCLPSNFGIISLLVVNASIAILVTGLGIDSIVLYSLSNKKWNFEQSVFFSVKALLVQLILFLIIEFCFFFITGKTLLSGTEPDYLLIEVLYFTGLSMTDKYLILFYSRNLMRLVNFILVIYTLCLLLFFLYLGTMQSLEFKDIFILFSVQVFLQGIILLVIFHVKFFHIRFERLPFSEVMKALKLSAIVLITNVIQFIAYRIDFLIISGYHSRFEVGIYAQANKFANLVWLIPNITALMIISKIPFIDERNIFSFFRLAVLSIIIAMVGTVGASLIFFHFILRPEFMDCLNILFILLPGYMCWGLVIYFAAYFSAKGLFRVNLTGSALCFILIILLDFILIPPFSLAGAAVSATIAYSATLIYYLIVFSGRTSGRLSALFTFKKSDIVFAKSLIYE